MELRGRIGLIDLAAELLLEKKKSDGALCPPVRHGWLEWLPCH